jgi:predicted enzyme related to lactoylglutathione lyase
MSRFVHVEITADDFDRAKKFYAEGLGLTGADSGMPGMDYWLIAGGVPDQNGVGGAIMPRKYQTQPTIATISVDDVTAAMEKVKAAGGKVNGDVQDIPGVGKHVYITDTEGNVVGLLQPSGDMQGTK